jgi:SAM-dependent methyltransferase
MKSAPTRFFDRLGLLRPAFRAYETIKSSRFARDVTAQDGLPVPPPKLRMRVICTPEHEAFLSSGELAAQTVRETLAENDLDIGAFDSILEFGCGCGRVLRHWKDLSASVSGSDYDGDQVKWCRANLPFADVRKNETEPPLRFDDGQFDLVYSLSVFIHIAPDGQRPWIDDIHRVMTPGGHLLLSTHGSAYRDEMSPDERERFDRGEFVFRWPSAAGTSLSAGFHPDSYLRELTREFELVAHYPAAARDTREDLYLLRRGNT